MCRIVLLYDYFKILCLKKNLVRVDCFDEIKYFLFLQAFFSTLVP